MEGLNKNSFAIKKARAFYSAQGCSFVSSEELLLSLKKHELTNFKNEIPQKENEETKKVFLSKLSVAKKYLPLLTLVPYSKIFLLSGSLACGQPKETSDIDLVVVAKENRLWSNRLLLQLATFLFGRRRTQKKFSNRFCFNYSLSDKEPVFENKDFVSAHFYKHLLPLWASSQTNIKQFWRANSWIKNYSPFFPLNQKVVFNLPHKNKINFARSTLEKFLELTGLAFLLEKFSFWLQRTIILKKLAGSEKSSSSLVILKKSLIHYHFPRSNWKMRQDLFDRKMVMEKAVEKV